MTLKKSDALASFDITKEEMAEILIWFSKDGERTFARQLLSYIMGNDIKECFYPLHIKEARHCFELYESCSFIRRNIEKLYNMKVSGLVPVWKILFEEYYPLYKRGVECWDCYIELSTIRFIRLLQKLGVDYTVEYGEKEYLLVYEIDGVEYKIRF